MSPTKTVALSLALMAGTALAQSSFVSPETTTPVILSSTDVNRIVCTAGEINDVFYSKEKGMTIVNKGRNAFVKYLIRVQGEAQTRVAQPTEIHLVCAGEVFTLIAKPVPGQARTVRLASGLKERIQKNIERMGAMPFEEQVIALTRAAYQDEIPEGFAVKTMASRVEVKPQEAALKRIFAALEVIKRREIRVEGLGMRLSEYTVKAQQAVELHETDFLEQAFGAEIAGVTVQPLNLKPGLPGRVLIVERVVN